MRKKILPNMILEIIIVTNVCAYVTYAEKSNVPNLSALFDTTNFFLNWKTSNEKIDDLRTSSFAHGTNRHNDKQTQRQKLLETKFFALRDLYDEKNWKHIDNGLALTRVKRNARQYPGLYDSLLTRRTFIPSFRTILIELSLMTLSVFVMNAIENAMHQPKKAYKPPNRHRRHFIDEPNYVTTSTSMPNS